MILLTILAVLVAASFIECIWEKGSEYEPFDYDKMREDSARISRERFFLRDE
jgi:hypothetical protein